VQPGDAAAIDATVAEGFETYRAFAPACWKWAPFPASDQLAQPGAWCEVAEDDEAGVIAHVIFAAARTSREPRAELIPGLAHLAALFVREPWWGTGLARELLGAAVTEMTAQGYREARLYAAEGQARARRFYAREGWRQRGAPQEGSGLGIPIVELRRPLGKAA
jgi:GNAT superfamily N-acetyltransferase